MKTDIGGLTGLILVGATSLGITLVGLVARLLRRPRVEEQHSDGTGKAEAYTHEDGGN